MSRQGIHRKGGKAKQDKAKQGAASRPGQPVARQPLGQPAFLLTTARVFRELATGLLKLRRLLKAPLLLTLPLDFSGGCSLLCGACQPLSRLRLRACLVLEADSVAVCSLFSPRSFCKVSREVTRGKHQSKEICCILGGW